MRLYNLLSVVLLFFFISSAHSWVINNYDVEIKVEPDSSLHITEKIVVDFGTEKKHGIYRDIPTKFVDPAGKEHSIDIHEIYVEDQYSNIYKTKQSFEGNNLRIRIGDPDKFVSGIQHYIIHYRVKYALYRIDETDELYWNAIGTMWPVPINGGSAKVILPFDDPSIRYACYTGRYGSTDKHCLVEKRENEIIFSLTRPLAIHEGMTVAVGWKSGLIQIQQAVEKKAKWWQNTWLYLPIYLTLWFAFLFWHWWKKGRDIGGRGVVQVQYYPPENLTPIEAGALIDERLDTRDIVAEIVDLARRGYIKISEIKENSFLFFEKTDYLFEKVKDFETDAQLTEFDLKILKAIFGNAEKRKLSSLKKNFYKSIKGIENSVFSSLITKGFFTENPKSIRNNYFKLGLSLLAFLIILVFIFVKLDEPLYINPGPIFIAGIITASSLFILAQFMPRKTDLGTEMKEYLQGYEEFISKVERDIIEKLFSPEEIPKVFETTLPFAIVFNEAEAWVEAFRDLFVEPEKGVGSGFLVDIRNVGSFTNQTSQVLSSSPRSSGTGGASGGGGFSGGGGGGGGGSAW